MWHLVARHWSMFGQPKVTDPWVQEELIFPPMPADKTKPAYYAAQDKTKAEYYRHRDPGCIEYYLSK